jgi:hypothetical protein
VLGMQPRGPGSSPRPPTRVDAYTELASERLPRRLPRPRPHSGATDRATDSAWAQVPRSNLGPTAWVQLGPTAPCENFLYVFKGARSAPRA